MHDVKEYSKRVIRIMVTLWFIGALYGCVAVTAELVALWLQLCDEYYMSVTVHLPELLTYIAAPLTGGIIGYMAKSAFENREKIKYNFKPDNASGGEDIP